MFDAEKDALYTHAQTDCAPQHRRYEAFRGGARDVIRNRAYNPGFDRYESELSGEYKYVFERSHINHYFQKYNHRRYNHPDNGLYVSIFEHLAYHMLFEDRPTEIGMTRAGNKFAIEKLQERAVRESMNFDGIITYKFEIQKATDLWVARLYGEQ